LRVSTLERMTTPPVFTPAQIAEDGRNRVGRTGGQNAVAAAVVLIVVEGLKGLGWLHGGISVELGLAYALVLTVGASALMNLGRLRGRG
jgi:hypothetical protein